MSSPATVSVPYAFTARTFNSQFADASDTYNALSVASDGNVYYALSSGKPSVGAQMFRYDPRTPEDPPVHLADITEVSCEGQAGAVAQGKVHVDFHELKGKLYFASHLGYYHTLGNGRELPGRPPLGVKPYPGGHFLSYDLATGDFLDLGIPAPGEGIIAMALDSIRGLLYGLSWPHGLLVVYDLASGVVTNLGPTSSGGEAGTGAEYRALCRSLAIDLPSGNVYLTVADGSMVRASGGKLSTVPQVTLHRPMLGTYDLTVPGELGYNWRQTAVDAPGRLAYGVHGRTGTSLLFDMASEKLQIGDRIASLPTRRQGVLDVPRHGYLGFKLAPSGQTIFYLTGGHISDADTALEIENLHLVTLDIQAEGGLEYRDHGSIGLDTDGIPSNVNSVAVSADGTVYAIAGISKPDGSKRYDLIAFQHVDIRSKRFVPGSSAAAAPLPD